MRYQLGQEGVTERASPMLDGEIDAKDATTLRGAITALLGVAAKK